MSKYWNISAPITVHVEVTESCNERCRHCYNFSRCERFVPKSISKEQLDYLLEEFKKNKVMHIIITGGEPLLVLDKTIYLAEKALAAGMTVSLNSNLVAANDENMKKIRAAGIDHILTTLHSYKEEVHDFVASTPGAFKKIVKGIKAAQDNGVRVTVNTILFQFNKDDIYQTGKFVHSLGVNKFLANRTIPSPTNDQSLRQEFRVGPIEVKKMFADLIRLREELGIEVGTCRTVPQCFFNELSSNDEFLARGCAAGRKHLLLNVNGDAHACVHESKKYGNVYEIGLKKIWDNMAQWRTMDFIPDECQNCHLFDICDGGCRLIALDHTGSIKGFDNLRKGAQHLPQYKGGIKPEHLEAAKNKTFIVNPKFDFREEDGFYIVRTRGARVDFIDKKIGDIIISHHQNKTPIRLDDLGKEKMEKFAYYIKREILIPIKKGIKVLFIYPNNHTEGTHPIGIAMLSAVLKRAGHRTKLFDTTFFDRGIATRKELGEASLEFKKAPNLKEMIELDNKDMFKDLAQMVADFEPKLIAISATSSLYPLGIELLNSLPQQLLKEKLIIVGGVHSTVDPETVIKEKRVDMILRGEGEYVLLEIANRLRDKRNLDDIKGLWIKKEDKIIKNNSVEVVKDINKLPVLDLDIFDQRHFYKPFMGKVYRFLNYESSRGCPFGCTYCVNRFMQESTGLLGAKYHREKSIEKIIKELKYLKKKYNIQMIKFWDDTFLVKKREELKNFLDLYKKEIQLPFLINTRPELIDLENAQMLKEAGCVSLSIGIESGNEYLRKNLLNRYMSNEHIIRGFQICKNLGMRASSFNMMGLPYETREQIFDTIEVNKKAQPDACNISFFYPFKGTYLRDVCAKERFISQEEKVVNWHIETILNMPQISTKELKGIRKVFTLYVKAPKFLFPLIKFCEKDNFLSDIIFKILNKYYYFKIYGFNLPFKRAGRS